jgi:hypothetical protein
VEILIIALFQKKIIASKKTFFQRSIVVWKKGWKIFSYSEKFEYLILLEIINVKQFFTKLWYKFFNKEKYIDLKNEKRTSDQVKYYNSRIYAQILEIQKKIENNKELSFLHSGRLGDLIYSLATIKELSKSHKCKLYIQIEKPILGPYDSSRKVFINKRCGDLILPLLRNQDFLDAVNIYKMKKLTLI